MSGYATRVGPLDGLDAALHYVIVGEHMGLSPSHAFDPSYYRRRYPAVSQAALSPLGHYLKYGRREGRRALNTIAANMTIDRSHLDEGRETILLISHESSRTGAPILAWNLAKRLRDRYNVVALLLSGGELVHDFEDHCAAVIGPLSRADWNPVDAEHIIQRLLRLYRVKYAIANSIESRPFIPSLVKAFVPVVSLIHEFASYTLPRGAMGEGLDWATQIVFSTDLTANSAIGEHPHLSHRAIHILPQGPCDIPHRNAQVASTNVDTLREVLRPRRGQDALVVLGAGFVQPRKGVDLFLSCAAEVVALRPKRPVRFIWIGAGYNPMHGRDYSTDLAKQIARAGLEGKVAIIDAIEDLEPAYAMSDAFFLSSRLDPLPNVTIDALFHGLPVVCFKNASGIAALLATEAELQKCVVPHLDVSAAARVIAEFADDESARKRVSDTARHFAEATFDMDQYVRQLDELGREAVGIMHQRALDFNTLRNTLLFDEKIFLPPDSMIATRDEAIVEFLARWAAVGASRKPATNLYFRRPCAGFHPQIYAYENSGRFDAALVNPLAHFIRSAKPDGPWCHQVITPGRHADKPAQSAELRTALHVHFYYPELAENFLKKLAFNRSHCDLLISTNTRRKVKMLRHAISNYDSGEVLIRVVPNRGRDVGPFLTAFADEILARYDVVGHLHGKRSLFALSTADPRLGERRREFLWQHLLGDPHPMMDTILHRFAADDRLGIVFAEEPTLSDWDDNLEFAADLAGRMGFRKPLPPFFDFPGGTMFWARADALRPLFDLKLKWDDYPPEPLPVDGTILHAIERLLPLVANHTGYRFATTHVQGISW
jgi:glycosyltransferase involved in cell wall biosynthesis